jgi:hypothetical protein
MAANRLRSLANAPLRRLFVGAAVFHFAKGALPLHFPLQGFESLVDVVVTHKDLHEGSFLVVGAGLAAIRPCHGLDRSSRFAGHLGNLAILFLDIRHGRFVALDAVEFRPRHPTARILRVVLVKDIEQHKLLDPARPRTSSHQGAVE